ncbi:MAG: hypothetical protein OXL38_07925, partial [Gammaproteobacteria bacterium]|nr:hypothetical protein [Gammaproteobacteria bacterium]
MATSSADLVLDEDRQLYSDESYMVLKGVVPGDMLRMLREECSYFLGYMDARASEALTFRGNLASSCPGTGLRRFGSAQLR